MVVEKNVGITERFCTTTIEGRAISDAHPHNRLVTMAQNQVTNISGVSNQALKINFSDPGLALQLFGQHDSHLQKIAAALDLNINTRGNTVFIQGDPIVSALAENILN